jgi:hypothetical protein
MLTGENYGWIDGQYYDCLEDEYRKRIAADPLRIAKVLHIAFVTSKGFYAEEWEELDAEKQETYMAQARAVIALF